MNRHSFALLLCFAPMVLTLRATAQEPMLSFAFPSADKESSFENKVTLREMKQKIPSKEIRYFDPLLRKVKIYLAFPVSQVLDLGFGKDWRNTMYSDIEFESATGKDKSSAKLYLFKDEGGYIAFQDMEAKSWEPVKSVDGSGIEMSPGPFYMFWISGDRSASDEYPWFLSLSRLKLLRFEEQYPLVVPTGAKPDSDVYKGYTVFRGQCSKCHSINRQGGKIGPDLNAPKSVTSYRETKVIKEFIRHPSKYRYTNMPDFEHLTESELDGLIAFFKFKDKNRLY